MKKVRCLAIVLLIACGCGGSGESDEQGNWWDNTEEFIENCGPVQEMPSPLTGQIPVLLNEPGSCTPAELDVVSYTYLCGPVVEVQQVVDECYAIETTEKGCEVEKAENFLAVSSGECIWEYSN